MKEHPRILFDEASHTYTLRETGAVVTGVTQALSMLHDFSMVKDEVLKKKQALGKAVHFAAELFDEDDLDEDSLNEEVGPYLEAYKNFKQHKVEKILLSEVPVYSKRYAYAGQLDRLFVIDGDCWLVDLKTPVCFSPVTKLQLAAYWKALLDDHFYESFDFMNELKSDGLKLGALHLSQDGKFKLHEVTRPEQEFTFFLSALNLHKWKEQNL